MICVDVLQNCLDVVEGGTASYNRTCVMCNEDGNEEVSITVEEAIDIKEEVSIKVEEAIDVKDEIPQAIVFPPIKTEQEVRLWGVCEVVAAHAIRSFMAPKRKLILHLTISCFVLYCGCHVPFEIWIAT